MDTIRSSRINQVARLIDARRYLEVGVCKGTTFFAVDVAEKVAVDPLFQFDHRAAETARARFHQVPSDTFFANARERAFDLIYLDGLHTFEQTLRDFLHSQRCAHAGTVWILDDTVPNDRYAALPDEAECFRLRRQVGNPDWAWMGDVYKVVFFIGAVMKDYDFRTWIGHGQTVVWRRPAPFPLADALPLEAIGTLPYEGLLEHFGMMRPAPDAEILTALAAVSRRGRWPEPLRKLAARFRRRR